MTHAEFVAAHARGKVRVEIDAKAAARFLSARLLLPFIMMPVLGIGVALALIGWFYTGLAVLAVGVAVPRLIKRGAPRFLLQQAIEDPSAYDALTRASVMRVAPFTESEQSATSTGR
ncbi:MAG: hypothetical protein OER43_13355 [Gammaproteobacteria bacterium]|nr:hypothetical protein [Gammaproteobacteria bacterium]